MFASPTVKTLRTQFCGFSNSQTQIPPHLSVLVELPRARSSSSHRGAARTGEQGSLHRQCRHDLPRAELPGAGAPRHRRPRKQLAVAVRSTRRLRRAHHYRRQRFASCGRGDACLPSASSHTQNGYLVCVFGWRTFSVRKNTVEYLLCIWVTRWLLC